MTTSETHGFTAPGFERVADVFAEKLALCDGLGAALAVRVGGETVVDLWGGIADERTGAAWKKDTATVVFSTTKGLTSLLAARLAEEGRLDYDAPVAEYWPEYAQAGKAGTLVRHLLSHRAGLSALREDISTARLIDWNTMVGVIERAEPLWEPGTGHNYHSLTFGWLVGEVLRRITGKTVGEYFRDAVTDPLGADAWIGLPADRAERVAHIRFRANPAAAAQERAGQTADEVYWDDRSTTFGGALPLELVSASGGFNAPDVRAAEMPGAGGIATARALAAIWSSAVTTTDGLRLINDDTLALVAGVQSQGRPVFGAPPPYGAWGMGFQLSTPPQRPYLGPRSIGHDGAGGQIGFADPDHGVGFAYISNLMREGEDDRGSALVEAVRQALSG